MITMDAFEGGLQVIRETIAKSGVTSILLTTMTISRETIGKALQCIKKVNSYQISGAKIIGSHLEGPYIFETYKVTQNLLYIQRQTYQWLKPYEELIKIITWVPEEDHDFEFFIQVKQKIKIVLSMGHASKIFIMAKETIQLGVSHVIHTFNGMPPFN